MRITVNRIFKGEAYTIGKMFINGEYFCDTLEDKVRDLSNEPKVMHETAIPEGRYKITLNYSPKFKRALPRLLNVPYFEGILIHRGNYADYKELYKKITREETKPIIKQGRYKVV